MAQPLRKGSAGSHMRFRTCRLKDRPPDEGGRFYYTMENSGLLHTTEAGGSLRNIIVVLFVHESSIPEPGRVLRFRRNRRRKVKTPAPQNESAAELGMRQRRLARAGAKAAEADGIGCGKTRTCGERAGLTASDAGMRTIRQAAPHRGLAEEIAVSLFLLPTNAFWIQYTWK